MSGGGFDPEEFSLAATNIALQRLRVRGLAAAVLGLFEPVAVCAGHSDVCESCGNFTPTPELRPQSTISADSTTTSTPEAGSAKPDGTRG